MAKAEFPGWPVSRASLVRHCPRLAPPQLLCRACRPQIGCSWLNHTSTLTAARDARRSLAWSMVEGTQGRYHPETVSKLAMSLRADTFAQLSDNRQCHRPHRYRLLQSHPRDTTCMIGHAGAVKLLLLVQTVWPAQSREPCKVRDGMDHPCLPENPGPLLSSHWLNHGGTIELVDI